MEILKIQCTRNTVCRIASFSIRRIGKLGCYLDKANTEKLVHAFVSSCLDNLNGLLYGLPDKELNKLQRIHNMDTRPFTLSRKRDHITPIILKLHWLSVRHRIAYKLLLTFKALTGQAPAYISKLISLYQPCRPLQSPSLHLLQEQSSNMVPYHGSWSFSTVSPQLWNSLPLQLRTLHTTTQFIFMFEDLSFSNRL